MIYGERTLFQESKEPSSCWNLDIEKEKRYVSQLQESYSLLDEGTNQDYTDAFRKNLAEYKDLMKNGKAKLKSGDTKAASKYFAQAKKCAKDIIDELEHIKKSESFGSGLIGYFIGCFMDTVIGYSMYIPVLGLGSYAAALYLQIKGTSEVLDGIVKGKITLGDFLNRYYRRLKAAATFLYDLAENFERRVTA